MRGSELAGRIDAAARVAAALVGSLPPAMFASVCLARFLPCAEDVRVAVGFAAPLPLWVATMCAAFVARTGARAWALCAALSVAFGALALGVPP